MKVNQSQIRQSYNIVEQNNKRKQKNNQIQNSNHQSFSIGKSKSIDDVSFKGCLDKIALGTANAIEKGGLFVSFTLQDMLGTNLPRPIMGLMRNSKENDGQVNKSFAAKEVVREFLTGPSMFIIPGAILALGGKIVGKTISVPMNLIKSFGEVHKENAVNTARATVSKSEFFQNTFANIIKNAKNEETITEETLSSAKEFADELLVAIKLKSDKKLVQPFSERMQDCKTQINGILSQKGQNFGFKFKGVIQNIIKLLKPENKLDNTITALADRFIEISKNNATNPVYTDFSAASVGNSVKATASFKDTVKHMMSYADDIVEKTKRVNKDQLVGQVDKLVNRKIVGRFATNILMFASVVAFLQIIPKLYNKAEGEGNSGLKGLIQENTPNSKKSEPQKSGKNNLSNSNVASKNKSTPSFGSLAGVSNKLTGSSTLGKLGKAIEFDSMNMPFPVMLAVMGIGILLPRTIQAKDKYDREEILRRDLVTCATMCFAEKELCKGFSKLNEAKSGFILTAKDANFQKMSPIKKLFEYLRPIKGVNVLSSDQIVSKYSGIEKYKDGVKGFCDFIAEQGGNLSKVFSLTDDSKKILDKLLKPTGKTLAEADNSLIRTVINEAKDSGELDNLANLFKDKNNAWVKKARTLNARFTALSVLVFVPVFLGFLLPFINERATKKRINKEKQATIPQNNVNNTFCTINKKTSIFDDIRKN